MVLYDSSVLIDYLAGVEYAVDYTESHANEPAVTIPIAMYEVFQGEVFKRGTPDFDAVVGALEWVNVETVEADVARTAAELQAKLARDGSPMGARDAYIAGAAAYLDHRLVASDADFEPAATTGGLAVELVGVSEN